MRPKTLNGLNYTNTLVNKRRKSSDIFFASEIALTKQFVQRHWLLAFFCAEDLPRYKSLYKVKRYALAHA